MTGEQNGRFALYLVMTFGITWVCWWPLASLIPLGSGVFSNATFSTLYLVGGLGPTLAALLAVALTPREGSLAAYAASLVRWRVALAWYVAAFLLPSDSGVHARPPRGVVRRADPCPFRPSTSCRAYRSSF